MVFVESVCISLEINTTITQPSITCLKSLIETPEQWAKLRTYCLLLVLNRFQINALISS